MKNVGNLDRLFRLFLGLALVWLGLDVLDGFEGSIGGILVALFGLLPLYMAFTATCFVFNWFKIHSFSQTECERKGVPYK